MKVFVVASSHCSLRSHTSNPRLVWRRPFEGSLFQSKTIVSMDELRLNKSTSTNEHVTQDSGWSEPLSIHLDTGISLSCTPFRLAEHYGQVFWSYSIYITALNAINDDNIISKAQARAQSLSNQRRLPSCWNFGAGTPVMMRCHGRERALDIAERRQQRLVQLHLVKRIFTNV